GVAVRESVRHWCQPCVWLLIAVVLAVAGEGLYLVATAHLPKAVTAVADKVSMTVTFSVLKDYKPLSLTASLAGILGLALGIVLFVAKGVKDALRLPNG